ncbi:IclR family transcriptional regulator [Thermoanaerobacterium thermosaccharolyticum]|uniref:Glycerol operon regulatory protein n=1 Tax=Thermoanaerobacterium thermosaccharolyticum TaxID=1517 RepID=A0A231VCG6_THETR|nr:IclR family transcriptional regulator [Thermoanaerobacterium thermosaccharolyticum]OXT05850.1 IclR family transcriptional regulator [Thermoanaerobacterium thermosaccharolyticum]
MDDNKNNQIKSVAKALAIIDYLASKNSDVPLSQISRDLNIAKSTAHGLITTLKDFGYIEQSQFTGNYKLGIHLFELGSKVANTLDVFNIASPYIRQLVESIGETVHLAILDKGEVLYIDKRESSRSIRISSQIGIHLPAHCTGVGKVLLAYLPIEEIREIIRNHGLTKYTKNTITDFDSLKEELEKIRECGYAVDNEEFMDGLKCIAAPIFNSKGNVEASLSISGPVSRMNGCEYDKAIKSILEVTMTISRLLGYRKES